MLVLLCLALPPAGRRRLPLQILTSKQIHLSNPSPAPLPPGPQELGWSGEESFTSPPAVGPGSSVTLLAVADVGQAEADGSMEASEMLPSLQTTARLAQEAAAGAQLLVHNGDLSCEPCCCTPCATLCAATQCLCAATLCNFVTLTCASAGMSCGNGDGVQWRSCCLPLSGHCACFATFCLFISTLCNALHCNLLQTRAATAASGMCFLTSLARQCSTCLT
jgi:hypothetical protein